MSSDKCTNCEENNIPSVNEESIECTELFPASCIRTTEYNSYFKISVGKSLTYVISTIAKYVRKISKRVDEIHNFDVWEGFLSQTSSNDPTVNVLKSDFDSAIVFTRNSAGDYIGTLTGAFTLDKTVVYVGGFDKAWGADVEAYRLNDDTIKIKTGASGGFTSDDILNETPILIKVYK